MIVPDASTFEALGLDEQLLRAVQRAGFQAPTPVQTAVIAAILAMRDVKARSTTGSGKTAAFGLPILQRLLAEPRSRSLAGNQVAVLIVAPTRELVVQIGEVLGGFAESLSGRIKLRSVYGGVAINPQMRELRGGADILVATPGRLLDLQRQNAVKFDQLRTLVLDEADRLLGSGFRDELTQVLALLPAQRQTLLFSATFPTEVEARTKLWLREPLDVDVTAVETGAGAQPLTREPDIEQHVYAVDRERKVALLIQLLQQRELRQVLVFVSMKKTGDALVAKLNRAQIQSAVFHADKSQRERMRWLSDFRTGQLRVLVATDLAARGIDIDNLPVVINFELPRSPNDYLHRIGRTGRAGRSGLALSLVCSAEEQHFRVIERRIKRRLPREQVVGFEPHAGGGEP
jgi:ATP-dependent RNA helicase RhlE